MSEVIPAEAVEVAADALSSRNGERFDVMARAALEAAAPHMQRTLWAEAYSAGFGDAKAGNPYKPEPTNAR